jgi:hypothetical protein
LIGNDTVALDDIKKTLKSVDINSEQLKKAFSEFTDFLQKYQGRVSGDFAYRFGRANATKLDLVAARGEIDTAKALLKDQTPLGNISRVKGIPGNEPKPGGISEEFTTPDFIATQTNGITRLVEAKTPTGNMSKTNIKNNLRDAIRSIKGSNEKTTAKGYVRFDYTKAPSTSLTQDEIFRHANGRLLTPDEQTGIKGTDVVEFVEFLYKDTAGQAQKLLLQVQNGKVIIVN